MCGLALSLRGSAAHEAGVNIDEQLEISATFLTGWADGLCGVCCYDVERGRGRLVGVLRLPGERRAVCFSDGAQHALAAAVCWRQFLEDANGVRIEVLE